MTGKGFGDNFSLDNTGGGSVADTDAAIYGPLQGRQSSVVARPIRLDKIWPDVVQPRRAIPSLYRGGWDGDPLGVIEVLERWAADVGVDTRPILRGVKETDDVDAQANPLLALYLDLLALAASIRVEGLINAISLVRNGGQFVIETGERRWLAYLLLSEYVDGERFGQIPATVTDTANVWRQAAENNARSQLNAISMARQLAILLMDMYEQEETFEPYGMMVREGNDRAYYAQVADGNLYRVKRGFGQKVRDAMGLKSVAQVRHYRALLGVPDEIWALADQENWTENRIREHMKALNNPQKNLYTVTPVTVSDEKGGILPPADDFKRNEPEQEYEPVRRPEPVERSYTSEVDDEPIPLQAETMEPAGDGQPVVAQFPAARSMLHWLLALNKGTAGDVEVFEIIDRLQKITVNIDESDEDWLVDAHNVLWEFVSDSWGSVSVFIRTLAGEDGHDE